MGYVPKCLVYDCCLVLANCSHEFDMESQSEESAREHNGFKPLSLSRRWV